MILVSHISSEEMDAIVAESCTEFQVFEPGKTVPKAIAAHVSRPAPIAAGMKNSRSDSFGKTATKADKNNGSKWSHKRLHMLRAMKGIAPEPYRQYDASTGEWFTVEVNPEDYKLPRHHSHSSWKDKKVSRQFEKNLRGTSPTIPLEMSIPSVRECDEDIWLDEMYSSSLYDGLDDYDDYDYTDEYMLYEEEDFIQQNEHFFLTDEIDPDQWLAGYC